jgi:hypothetical protein
VSLYPRNSFGHHAPGCGLLSLRPGKSGPTRSIGEDRWYNVYLVKDEAFLQAVSLADGPTRVAALAAWLQSLAPTAEERPVLVGGGAVELYSGGAYRTGDLDFVGSLGEEGERQLEAVGFRQQGRHWIHEEHQIFLEFPSSHLDEGERAAVIEVGEYSVVVIGLEELIVDRLAAWQSWGSEIDAVNAVRLRQGSAVDLDRARLREIAKARGVAPALQALEQFTDRLGDREPSAEELEDWTWQALKGTR